MHREPSVQGEDNLSIKDKKAELYCPLFGGFTVEVLHIQCFASQLSTGKSKWAVALKCLIRLGCLEQRQAVDIVTSTSCLSPISAGAETTNLQITVYIL